MSHPLDGARLKVVRAQEHLESLKDESRGYLDGHPYKIITEEIHDPQGFPSMQAILPDGSPKLTKYWKFTPEVHTLPPLRLSALIGDVVGNLRAALDYIVWQLALRY